MHDIIKLDTRGLKCPLPVLRLARFVRQHPSGTYIEIEASDPMAEIDIPHWVQSQRHELVSQKHGTHSIFFTIKII